MIDKQKIWDEAIDLTLLSPEEFLFYIQYKYSDEKYLYNIRQNANLIEEFQKRVEKGYFDGIFNLNSNPEEFKKEIIQEIINKLEKIKTPTSIENILWYSLLNDLSKDIIKAAQILNPKFVLKCNVLFGTMLTGKINACAMQSPSGDYIILLNQGLFTFSNLAAKAVASFIPYKDNKDDGNYTFSVEENDVAMQIEHNIQGHERFVDALIACIHANDPTQAKPYILDTKQAVIAELLRNTAELFVIAHEYSHVFLEHYPELKASKQENSPQEIDELCYCSDWADECFSDILALQLILVHNTERGLDLALSYVGIEFFLSLITILEEALQIEDSDSHPSASFRIEFLRHYMLKELPEHSENMLILGNFINMLATKIWEMNKTKIMDCQVPIKKND
ncbi:hypothetical protein [Anaerospora hongkongensis]|uniref:hypothetical protein n=1 Tax=Anaerospora hongkongensis TaxID=244830 RepID=UPI0028981A99|nr:hypothetical protein [Anaerospora hongkongensis]